MLKAVGVTRMPMFSALSNCSDTEWFLHRSCLVRQDQAITRQHLAPSMVEYPAA